MLALAVHVAAAGPGGLKGSTTASVTSDTAVTPAVMSRSRLRRSPLAAGSLDRRPSAQISGHMASTMRPGGGIGLEDGAADRREGDGGPGPGQLGSLPCQAGLEVLGIVGRCHQRLSTADSKTTTAATAPMAVIVTARIHGSTERGSGSPRRSARWLRAHSL